MPRYALKIEYVGTQFHGWQSQPNVKTVEGSLNAALKNLDHFSDGVTGAGRTDMGVHAIGQVAHFDSQRNWNADQLKRALNFYLKPESIAIVDSTEVDESFHARFSAIKRHYLFKIMNQDTPLTLEKNRYWHVRQPMDLEKMNEGAGHLIGTYDFTTFRSSQCQAKSPVKSIEKIEISIVDSFTGPSIHIKFEARSFLHNQIRSIIGTLVKVGTKSWSPERVKLALLAKSRSECGPVAPPFGLYLTKVDYKTHIFQCLKTE